MQLNIFSIDYLVIVHRWHILQKNVFSHEYKYYDVKAY